MLKVLDYIIEDVVDNKKHVRAIISVGSASELTLEHEKFVFTEATFATDLSTGDTYAVTNNAWVKQ